MQDHRQCGLFGLSSIDLSEDDVMSAMKSMEGYIDITPGDFTEIYQVAFRYAVERLSRLVSAQDIMTRQVITVSLDTALADIARKMAAANISGVPVVNPDQTIAGIISEKDFLSGMGGDASGGFMEVIAQCLANRGCLAMPIRDKTARDIMKSPVITAYSETPVAELSKKLAEHRINRIPVITGTGKLTGIVSRGDIVNSYCAQMV